MVNILDKISSVYKVVKSIGNVKLVKEISELKMAISGLIDENRKLKEELGQLKFNKDNPLEFRDGMYFASGEGIPCCVCCYDTNGKRVHLLRDINFANRHTYICPQCKTEHRPDEYRSR
jgi:hypothetical protein